MNVERGYESFKASFSGFKISEVCGGFFRKKNCLFAILQYVESLHAPN
jgi:hypothetical protein